MTDHSEPMERCASCSVLLPPDLAHYPHEPDCTDPDLCYCTTEPHCPLCCPCGEPPAVIPGQESLPLEASTKPLAKRRTT